MEFSWISTNNLLRIISSSNILLPKKRILRYNSFLGNNLQLTTLTNHPLRVQQKRTNLRNWRISFKDEEKQS